MNDDNIKKVFFINDKPIKKTKLKKPNNKPKIKLEPREPVKNTISFVLTFDDI